LIGNSGECSDFQNRRSPVTLGTQILPTLTGLPVQITSITDLSGGVQGTNSFRTQEYGGPCPPNGTGTDCYFFKLYALDQTLTLSAGAGKAEILAAAEGQILGSTELIGCYQRQA